MKIFVEIKNTYGNELVYPVCENAKAFARIAGTKTLSQKTLNEIKHLGYELALPTTRINWNS